eukprot:gb/GEZN01009456.1/.p1 GENE.gb/GEZN01009456.1/~~gb/GEZN01009456.1/.p1  ORF type:complete len:431 (+),score=57.34 gb/GEZN01009456.1/:170-1294(+)
MFGAVVGVGGGMVFLPFLAKPASKFLGCGLTNLQANATSLAAISATGVGSCLAYNSHNMVDWGAAFLLATSAACSSPLGARAVSQVSDRTIQIGFGLILLTAAPLLLFKKYMADTRYARESNTPPGMGTTSSVSEWESEQQQQQHQATTAGHVVGVAVMDTKITCIASAAPSTAVEATATTLASSFSSSSSTAFPSPIASSFLAPSSSSSSSSQGGATMPPVTAVTEAMNSTGSSATTVKLTTTKAAVLPVATTPAAGVETTQGPLAELTHSLQALSTQQTIVCLSVGSITGFISGAMGIGGGLILTSALALSGVMEHHTMLGTSLIAMVPPSLTGTIAHIRYGNVVARFVPVMGWTGLRTLRRMYQLSNNIKK